jgi:hypothetical protein
MAMTHADAAATQAVERYLLGELSADQRDAFEAHAFDCTACAEELQATAIFLDTSRSVLREDPLALTAAAEAAARAAAAVRPTGSPGTTTAAAGGWRAWLRPSALLPAYALVPALVLLVGFTLYQNLVTIPALRDVSAPRALSSFSFVSSGTRGATAMVIAAPARQPFLLFFDIPPDTGAGAPSGGHGRFATYHCAIVAADGTAQVAVDVPAAQARDTVQLFVPAARLRPGPHTLVITGENDGAGAAVAGGAGTVRQEIARYPFVLQGGA